MGQHGKRGRDTCEGTGSNMEDESGSDVTRSRVLTYHASRARPSVQCVWQAPRPSHAPPFSPRHLRHLTVRMLFWSFVCLQIFFWGFAFLFESWVRHAASEMGGDDV